MKKVILLGLYYIFIIRLPRNETPLIGTYLRKFRSFICKQIFASSGSKININKGAYFGNGHALSIGSFSGIGERCQVSSDTIMGSDVMMASEVLILSRSHNFTDIVKPMCLQGEALRQKVVIGNDVWIGQRVTILPGIKVGSGVIIGAGSVVTKNIPDFAIVAGNPARVIRSRKG